MRNVSAPISSCAWPGWRCRSYYQWLPPEATLTAQDWEGFDDFDLILDLFDFSAWRASSPNGCAATLARRPSLSIGLRILLARAKQWSWPHLTQELRSTERGQGYCRRLGIDVADIPSEATFLPRRGAGHPGDRLAPMRTEPGDGLPRSPAHP